ncbi:MAG: hypothetical protein K8W52_19545 [Deltaproteobacteria bacterium]|nr:hypothetical protein [Deltaproteobacteria bacterium]
MKRSRKKPLLLTTETVRTMSTYELASVAAGKKTDTSYTNNSCTNPACCAGKDI